MPKFRTALCLLSVLILLIAAPLQAAAQEITALFETAAAAWLSPKVAAMQSGTYALHTGDSAYVPVIAPEVTPFDKQTGDMSAAAGTFFSSYEQVVTVDEHGLMTGVAGGLATVTWRMENGAEYAYTVTVSTDALPERAKAFVYVARREFLLNQLSRLPKANQYTKWYYRSQKEVGWCSVFTIWCANASGTNPIPGENAGDIADDEVLFLREGQVGNQYDGFSKLGRFVGTPRPGYLVIYANMSNTYLFTHIGIVTEAKDLGSGLYQITTVEGNMSSTVKCYTFVYDSNASNHFLTSETREQQQPNMSVVPEENRTDPLTQYELSTESWTVFGFCATWQ